MKTDVILVIALIENLFPDSLIEIYVIQKVTKPFISELVFE